MEGNLENILDRFKEKDVLVVGDVMLDIYREGSSSRISPEAPVPVILQNKVLYSPGGAANVALNLYSLSSNVSVLGVVGDDNYATELRRILVEKGIDDYHLVTDDSRPTTTKERIMSGQHIARIDIESEENISEEIHRKFLYGFKRIAKNFDAIILQDYDKGIFNDSNIREINAFAKENNVPVYVDPKKINFHYYKDIRFFKPNLKEFEEALPDSGSLTQKAKEFRKNQNIESLLITLGEEGAHLFNPEGDYKIPTKVAAVSDVSGAGDTFISAFTLSDISGATYEESTVLANYASGIVVGKAGTATTTIEEIKERINQTG